MAILNSCCYWKSVRTGCFMSAIYTLVYFGFSSYLVGQFVNEEWQFITGQRKRPAGLSFLDAGYVKPNTVTFNIISLICSILMMMASLISMAGLYWNIRWLLLPWIVIMFCDILVECVHIVSLLLKHVLVVSPVVGFLFTLDFFMMCLNYHNPQRVHTYIQTYHHILNLYCLLCMISQYQIYKENHQMPATMKLTNLTLINEQSDKACCPNAASTSASTAASVSVSASASTKATAFEGCVSEFKAHSHTRSHATSFVPSNMSAIAEESLEDRQVSAINEKQQMSATVDYLTVDYHQTSSSRPDKCLNVQKVISTEV